MLGVWRGDVPGQEAKNLQCRFTKIDKQSTRVWSGSICGKAKVTLNFLWKSNPMTKSGAADCAKTPWRILHLWLSWLMVPLQKTQVKLRTVYRNTSFPMKIISGIMIPQLSQFERGVGYSYHPLSIERGGAFGWEVPRLARSCLRSAIIYLCNLPTSVSTVK